MAAMTEPLVGMRRFLSPPHPFPPVWKWQWHSLKMAQKKPMQASSDFSFSMKTGTGWNLAGSSLPGGPAF